MKRYVSRLVCVAVLVTGSLGLSACPLLKEAEPDQRHVVSSRPIQIGEEWTEVVLDPPRRCERYFDTLEVVLAVPVELPVRLPFPLIEYSIEQLDGTTISGPVSSLMTSPGAHAWVFQIEFQQDPGVSRQYRRLRLRSAEPFLANEIHIRSWTPPDL